jgi:hypothetical protein
MFPTIGEVGTFVIPAFVRIAKLFVNTDKRLTGAGPWPPGPAPVPAPGTVGAGVGVGVVAALPPSPPPHPATKAASSNVINHIGNLKMFSDLFILLLLKNKSRNKILTAIC